jgi:hypothetical protein
MRLYNLPTSARDGGDSDDGDGPPTEIAVGIATQSQVSRGGGTV